MVVVFINAETSSSYMELPTSVGFLPPPGDSVFSLGKGKVHPRTGHKDPEVE